MLGNVLLVLIAAVVLCEVVEHVLVPLTAVLRGTRRPPVGSAGGMPGRTVEVTRWEGTSGQVRLGVEYWSAECSRPLTPGDRAVVRAVRGVTLTLDPVAGPGTASGTSGDGGAQVAGAPP